MIDDDAQLGMAPGKLADDGEMAWLQQRIEAQTVARHRGKGRLHRWKQYPGGVLDILQHRPKAFDQRIAGKLGDARRRMRRREISPADHAADQTRRLPRD